MGIQSILFCRLLESFHTFIFRKDFPHGFLTRPENIQGRVRYGILSFPSFDDLSVIAILDQ